MTPPQMEMLSLMAMALAFGLVGIAAGALMLIPSTAGTIGLIFFGSLATTAIWLILMARRLFQLGKDGS